MATDEAGIHRGLEGVVVDSTRISKVMPEINALVYHGYPVQELAEQCSFEEVAWLLWHGELPTARQLAEFEADERGRRQLSPELLAVIRNFPRSAHPMDALRTAVSFLGMEDPEPEKEDAAANSRRALDLLAKIPSMLGAFYRLRKGLEIIPPRPDLSIAANFFHVCFGKVPAPEIVKAFDVSLVLYAEHGFNASTFTARVVVSSLSDIYSGVTAGIGSLKGALHGGANEAVMKMLLEIGSPGQAREWMLAALRDKRKVMGFGHRVYKKGDSRVPTMKKYGRLMATFTGQSQWLDIADILESTMLEQKGIHANLDFPSGPAYYMMGIDIDFYTPIFVMARITGWTAHILEQLANNRLIRPLSQYSGPPERHALPLNQRG
ncbi:MAG: 2-methylcitrate synthase [Verrucomicrobiota bacterium]|jgi:2-methylcitrate synthase